MLVATSPDSRCLAVRRARLDGAAGRQLLRAAERAFRSGAPAIVVDLSSVRTIDAPGMAALVALRRGAPAAARIFLAGLSPRLLVIAAATCLHELFELHARVETALATAGA